MKDMFVSALSWTSLALAIIINAMLIGPLVSTDDTWLIAPSVAAALGLALAITAYTQYGLIRFVLKEPSSAALSEQRDMVLRRMEAIGNTRLLIAPPFVSPLLVVSSSTGALDEADAFTSPAWRFLGIATAASLCWSVLLPSLNPQPRAFRVAAMSLCFLAVATIVNCVGHQRHVRVRLSPFIVPTLWMSVSGRS